MTNGTSAADTIRRQFGTSISGRRQRTVTADGKPLTQSGLADLVGTDQGTISRLENGNISRLDIELLLDVAAALQVEASDLYVWPPHIVELHSLRNQAKKAAA